MSRDARVDAYIARQADFARPILAHIRRVLHAAGPKLEETIKWGMPHFTYKGRLFAAMAAFKAHATLALPHASGVLGESGAEREAMGQFGRLTSLADLPPEDELAKIVRRAAALADAAGKPRPKAGKPEAETPEALRAALVANPAAEATFDGFPPSCRREYADWIVAAKRPETRAKRIAQAVEWMAEGKRRHWKYEKG